MFLIMAFVNLFLIYMVFKNRFETWHSNLNSIYCLINNKNENIEVMQQLEFKQATEESNFLILLKNKICKYLNKRYSLVNPLAKELKRSSRYINDGRMFRIYKKIKNFDSYECDDVIDECRKLKLKTNSTFFKVLNSICKISVFTGPIKFCIIFFGYINNLSADKMLMTFGFHPEFTLYVAITLARLNHKNSESLIWELAQSAHNDIKLALVELLVETKNEDIKQWLLTEGYQNELGAEYTGLIIAKNCDLLSRLKADDVSLELLMSASKLIRAIINTRSLSYPDKYLDAEQLFHVFYQKTFKKSNAHFMQTYLMMLNYLEDQSFIYDNLNRQHWDLVKKVQLKLAIKYKLNM